MSKSTLHADSATEAYDLLEEKHVFHCISRHFRLFKTAQRGQDEYLQIRPLPGTDPALFVPTTYRADRDVIDILMAADVPTAIRVIKRLMPAQPGRVREGPHARRRSAQHASALPSDPGPAGSGVPLPESTGPSSRPL